MSSERRYWFTHSVQKDGRQKHSSTIDCVKGSFEFVSDLRHAIHRKFGRLSSSDVGITICLADGTDLRPHQLLSEAVSSAYCAQPHAPHAKLLRVSVLTFANLSDITGGEKEEMGGPGPVSASTISATEQSLTPRSASMQPDEYDGDDSSSVVSSIATTEAAEVGATDLVQASRRLRFAVRHLVRDCRGITDSDAKVAEAASAIERVGVNLQTLCSPSPPSHWALTLTNSEGQFLENLTVPSLFDGALSKQTQSVSLRMLKEYVGQCIGTRYRVEQLHYFDADFGEFILATDASTSFVGQKMQVVVFDLSSQRPLVHRRPRPPAGAGKAVKRKSHDRIRMNQFQAVDTSTATPPTPREAWGIQSQLDPAGVKGLKVTQTEESKQRSTLTEEELVLRRAIDRQELHARSKLLTRGDSSWRKPRKSSEDAFKKSSTAPAFHRNPFSALEGEEEWWRRLIFDESTSNRLLLDGFAREHLNELSMRNERRAEAKRQAEVKRAEEEQRRAEEQRQVEAKRAEEEQRRAEEQRQAEASRVEEEQRRAEAKRAEEEQRRAEIEAKRAKEEQLRAEEQRQAEIKRVEEEQRRAEASRAEEEQRQAEELAESEGVPPQQRKAAMPKRYAPKDSDEEFIVDSDSDDDKDLEFTDVSDDSEGDLKNMAGRMAARAMNDGLARYEISN